MLKRALLSIACLLLALPLLSPAATQAAPSPQEISEAEERLLELERDFQLVSERYNLVADRLESLQARIAATELEVDVLERRIRKRQDAAVTLAQALYKGGSSGMEALLTAESFTEIEQQLTYLEASEEGQLRVFERLNADKDELDFKVADLQRAQERAVVERDRLAELRETIESKVEGQLAEVERLNDLLEQARRRQARRERERREAALAATAFPTVSVPKVPPAQNPNAQIAVDAALSQLGKPYRWAAAGPDAYDCSGLTMWAWAQAGVALPHNSGAQYAATPRVAREDIQPGDLLFFGSPIHHVGMYIGDGRMVEAPYSGQVVRVNAAFRSDLVGIGRPG